MKKNTKIAALVALGLVSVSAAHASTTDLLLGFNDAAGPSPAQNDYVIDLGLSGQTLIADAQANSGTYNFGTIINSGTFSTAFSGDSGYLNDVAVGVVGGNSSATPKSIFQTDLNTPPVIFAGQFNQAVASAQSPAISEYASTSQSGWTYYIAQSPTEPGTEGLINGNDVADQTDNPLGQLNNGLISLNLWEDTKTGNTISGWVDEGTFDINVNSDTVSFVTSVPEPATYGILAGAGLLLVALRRQFASLYV